jgi:hypothetical protein
LESVVHTNISGHGYGKYVDDEGLEDPLKSMIFEMGLALGKTAEELKDLTTYHGIVYDDFA